MISSFSIRNFKSIKEATLELGRITVLIGENGSGKSNILESIAFASAGAANKIDNTYLFSRGVRDTDPQWMQSAFRRSGKLAQLPMHFSALAEGRPPFDLEIQAQNHGDSTTFEKWLVSRKVDPEEIVKITEAYRENPAIEESELNKAVMTLLNVPEIKKLLAPDQRKLIEGNKVMFAAAVAAFFGKAMETKKFATDENLSDFIIFSPESSVLRTPPPEGYTHPVGTKGEGLFKLLQSFSELNQADRLKEIKDQLKVFGWFKDFTPPSDIDVNQSSLQIQDKWIDSRLPMFDQRSANEGFLFVLFYIATVVSSLTPRFFAFDNIENALNPRLCTLLMKRLGSLAKKHDKQIICTTHSPAILDGINLNDKDYKLYSVRRSSKGHTLCTEIHAPTTQEGETPMPLSEAFSRGIIGGLPNHF